MEKDILITVAITCFREGLLLRQCWNSVLNQTNSKWRAIIVVDAGFDENTKHVINELKHPSLRVFFNSKNLGPYLSRNKAFEHTETPYHYYLDGDDYLDVNAVEEFYAAYNNFPNADIYYTDLYAFHNDKKHRLMKSAAEITGAALTEGFALYGANIIKKEVWEKVGGYKKKYNWTLGDLDFYMSCCELEAKFCHIALPLYFYRRRKDSVSEQYTSNYHIVYEQLVSDHPLLFKNSERSNTFLSNGFLASAQSEWANCNFVEAEDFIQKAISLRDSKNCRNLKAKIDRDKNWPVGLLKTKRKFAIRLSNILKK